MKVFLVTVRPPIDTGGRYFDSIWVVKDHADERCEQLITELRRSGYRPWYSGQVLPVEWHVTVTEAQAADGQLAV